MPSMTHDLRCSIQVRGKKFCDAPSHPDMPFPICANHAAELWRSISRKMKAPEAQKKARKRGAKVVRPPGVVYFLRFRDRIKIGFTTNLRERLMYVPHDELLATAPGTMEDERWYHSRFDHLRDSREWFREGPELLSLIEELKE